MNAPRVPTQSTAPFDGPSQPLFNKPWWGFYEELTRGLGLSLHTSTSGTHAARLATDPTQFPFPLGALFAETDRAVYQIRVVTSPGGSPAPTWVYAYGEMAAPIASLPADLSINDSGFLFDATDYGHKLRWNVLEITAASWAGGVASITVPGHSYFVGQSITIAGAEAIGFNTTAAITVVAGSVISYALASNPGAYIKAGFACGWGWAPGEEGSGRMVVFEVDPTGAGWHLYDGTVGVVYLKADGTTGLVTLPDLVSTTAKAAYLKMGSPDAGVVAAIAPVATGAAGVIAVAVTGISNPAATGSAGSLNTGNDSATKIVASGTGATVAADPHTHLAAAHTHTIGAPTDPGHTHTFTPTQPTISATGEPQNLVRRPWFRQ
jgi:hypothetical protein